MTTKTVTLKRNMFFVLVGLVPTFVLSGRNENVQKLDKNEASWAFVKKLSPESGWVFSVGLFLLCWFYLLAKEKSLYDLKKELRELKRKTLPPLEIEKKIQENINEINQNLKKYDQAVKENNQQNIFKTGRLLKDLKEDLDDLNAISNIQKRESTISLESEFEKVPPINNKPLVIKEEKLPLFEQFDKVIVDLENRKIIERQGGHLKAHKKNKVVPYNDEYRFRKQALYNKKNNIRNIQTNALLETIERNKKKAKKKAEKIRFFQQVILEKEKQPLKNKKDIEEAKKKIEMHNRQINDLIRIDLKENLNEDQWDDIKVLYPDPRQKEPETREELKNEISRLNKNKRNKNLKQSFSRPTNEKKNRFIFFKIRKEFSSRNKPNSNIKNIEKVQFYLKLNESQETLKEKVREKIMDLAINLCAKQVRINQKTFLEIEKKIQENKLFFLDPFGKEIYMDGQFLINADNKNILIEIGMRHIPTKWAFFGYTLYDVRMKFRYIKQKKIESHD